MKQLIIEEKGRPVLADVAKPVCREDTVLLKTRYSGISNGTERNMMMGGNYNPAGRFPATWMGYQAVSEVVECGDRIERFSVGDLVATGTSGVHAEFHLATESDLICRLPADYPPEEGAFLSVCAVAYHDVKRAGVTHHDRVLVTGGGPIGLFAMQASRLEGAHTTLLNRGEERARIAEELGADAIIFGNEEEIDRQLQAAGPFSAVIETTGNAQLICRLIGEPSWKEGVFERRSRARIAMIGGAWEVAYNSNSAQMVELAVVHAQHYDQVDLEAVNRLTYEGRIRIRPIIRDVVPASRAVEIFQRLRDEPRSLLGTVLSW